MAAWERFKNDFDAMSDEQVSEQEREAQDQANEAEDWLEAVASWREAGCPRNGKPTRPIDPPTPPAL